MCQALAVPGYISEWLHWRKWEKNPSVSRMISRKNPRSSAWVTSCLISTPSIIHTHSVQLQPRHHARPAAEVQARCRDPAPGSVLPAAQGTTQPTEQRMTAGQLHLVAPVVLEVRVAPEEPARRGEAHPELHAENAKGIPRTDLLPVPSGAGDVRDRDLVEAVPQTEHLGHDLGLDLEAP